MNKVTYGTMDKVLRSLGFTCRLATLETKGRLYEHPGTGALIALPVLPEDETVLPRHLALARGVLGIYGIADPLDFDLQLQTAG